MRAAALIAMMFCLGAGVTCLTMCLQTKQNVPKKVHAKRVHVGRHGELRVNGKTVFPIGVYHVGKDDLSRIKDLGFNCVTSPELHADQRHLTDEQHQWYDEAQRQGLWVIWELSGYIRNNRRNFEQVRSIVSELRLLPATLVYYAIDEPCDSGISHEVVEQMCKVIREADPDHPTLVHEYRLDFPAYARIAEIFSTHCYPQMSKDGPESLAIVGDYTEKAVAISEGRPVWPAISVHCRGPHYGGYDERPPMPKEIRCMTYLALNRGAKGLLFYAWGDAYHFPPSLKPGWTEEIQSFFKNFTKELAYIGIHYLFGQLRHDVTVEPKDAPLDAIWLIDGKTKFAVIINPTSKPVKAKVSWLKKFEREFGAFEVCIAR